MFRLGGENRARGRADPELLDNAVLYDDRCFDVIADDDKAGLEDKGVRVRVPDARPLRTAERPQRNGARRGRLLNHESLDGEAGDGIGASHQMGWTGLVADLIVRRERAS